MTFTDRDLGYEDLLKGLLELDEEPSVLVGIRGDNSEDRQNLVGYAAANEFGSSRSPARPFLRPTVDRYQRQYEQDLTDAVKKVTETGNGADLKRDLDRLGLKAVGHVQAYITELQEPPNSPTTIERKGSSNPLIDTGRMRQSIDYTLASGKGLVNE